MPQPVEGRAPGDSRQRSAALLVLAAGASRRMGSPKQLLPWGGGVLIEAALGMARECAAGRVVDQLLLALGGAGDEVRENVDLSGFDLVDNPDFGSGCASSIAAALPALDPGTNLLVLALADQPGVLSESVAELVRGRGGHVIAVCRYDDGIGHPFAFDRSMFSELAAMHGDKAVWKLIERHRSSVVEVPVPGDIPLDIDTEADYAEALATLQGVS